MYYEDEDEDLRRAMEASLQEAPKGPVPEDVHPPVSFEELKVDFTGPRAPLYHAKLMALSKRYQSMRPVRGEGNCFYRSFWMGWIGRMLDPPATAGAGATESVLFAPNQTVWAERMRELSEQAAQFLPEMQAAEVIGLGDAFVQRTRALCEAHASGGEAALLIAARRTPETAEALRWLRLVTSAHMRVHADHFEPFAGPLRTGNSLPIAEYCVEFVEKDGALADEPELQALTSALNLGVRVEYLNEARAPWSARCGPHRHVLRLPPSSNSALAACVLFRPGHYDMLTPHAWDDPTLLEPDGDQFVPPLPPPRPSAHEMCKRCYMYGQLNACWLCSKPFCVSRSCSVRVDGSEARHEYSLMLGGGVSRSIVCVECVGQCGRYEAPTDTTLPRRTADEARTLLCCASGCDFLGLSREIRPHCEGCPLYAREHPAAAQAAASAQQAEVESRWEEEKRQREEAERHQREALRRQEEERRQREEAERRQREALRQQEEEERRQKVLREEHWQRERQLEAERQQREEEERRGRERVEEQRRAREQQEEQRRRDGKEVERLQRQAEQEQEEWLHVERSELPAGQPPTNRGARGATAASAPLAVPSDAETDFSLGSRLQAAGAQRKEEALRLAREDANRRARERELEATRREFGGAAAELEEDRRSAERKRREENGASIRQEAARTASDIAVANAAEHGEAVEQLVAMGFFPKESRDALRQCGNRVDEAVELLFSRQAESGNHPPPPSTDAGPPPPDFGGGGSEQHDSELGQSKRPGMIAGFMSPMVAGAKAAVDALARGIGGSSEAEPVPEQQPETECDGDYAFKLQEEEEAEQRTYDEQLDRRFDQLIAFGFTEHIANRALGAQQALTPRDFWIVHDQEETERALDESIGLSLEANSAPKEVDAILEAGQARESPEPRRVCGTCGRRFHTFFGINRHNAGPKWRYEQDRYGHGHFMCKDLDYRSEGQRWRTAQEEVLHKEPPPRVSYSPPPAMHGHGPAGMASSSCGSSSERLGFGSSPGSYNRNVYGNANRAPLVSGRVQPPKEPRRPGSGGSRPGSAAPKMGPPVAAGAQRVRDVREAFSAANRAKVSTANQQF
jgi:hypothetical protein